MNTYIVNYNLLINYIKIIILYIILYYSDKSKSIDHVSRSITSNGDYVITPPNDITFMEKVYLNVSVPLPNIELTKMFSLDYNNYENSTSSQYEINPDNGYDAIKKVILNVEKVDSSHLVKSVIGGGGYSNQNGFYIEYSIVNRPSNDNTTTSAQKVMVFRPNPTQSHNFYALNSVELYQRIQYITLENTYHHFPM